MDFPFETTCEVAVEDGTTYIHVDLPEIEDVIPEFRADVLQDGRVRQVKRAAAERNAEYAYLVMGLGLFLAHEVACVSPQVRNVRVAAYTQRKKRGSEQEANVYVYDVQMERSQVESVDFASVDPMAFAANIGGTYEQKTNMELKAIRRPTWTLGFDSAGRDPGSASQRSNGDQ